MCSCYVSPLYTEGETYRLQDQFDLTCYSVACGPCLLLTAHFYVTSVLCLCVLFSPSIMRAFKHETLTQCRAIVGPPSTTLSQHYLAQYRVTMSCLTPRCMWASVTNGGPTLTQLLFKALCGYYSQYKVGLLTTVEWILASTGDAAPTITRHWLDVGLHCLTCSPANTRL